MADPLKEQDIAAPALELVHHAAAPYLNSLPERLVHDTALDPLIDELTGSLPEQGDGTMAAVERLLTVGTKAAIHTAGPRFFHLVVGGATPAAMAGDWIA